MASALAWSLALTGTPSTVALTSLQMVCPLGQDCRAPLSASGTHGSSSPLSFRALLHAIHGFRVQEPPAVSLPLHGV